MAKKEERKQTRLIPKRKNNQIDIPLLITILCLVAFGLVMILSASAPKSLNTYGNSYHFVLIQGGAALLGFAFMFIFSRTDYHIFKKGYMVIYILSVLALFLVLVPGLGTEVGGAKRWIRLSGLGSFQPSELTKIGLIMGLSGWYTSEKRKHHNYFTEIIVPLAMGIIPAVIVYKVQNHMSAAAIMMVITIVVMYVSEVKTSYIITTLVATLTIGGSAFVAFKDKIINGFRSDRIAAWKDPLNSTLDSAYQTKQSLYAIGTGRLLGVGLGQSKQKYTYLPESHNDFIFAIIAEELGFVGCALVVILFAIFAVRGILISVRAKDLFGKLIATGIIAQVMIQAIANICVVTAVMPNTGVSLPFLSYGGTALMVLLASLGIVLNISRNRNSEEAQ